MFMKKQHDGTSRNSSDIRYGMSEVLDILGISTILYLILLGMLMVYAVHTDPFLESLAFHHSFSEFFVIIAAIAPALLSVSLAVHLFHILRRFRVYPAQSGALPRVFLKVQLLVFVGILAWTFFQHKTRLGYWFARPGLDRRIYRATELVSITPVFTIRNSDGTTTFTFDAGNLIRADDALKLNEAFDYEESTFLDDASLYEQEHVLYDYTDMSLSGTNRIFMALGKWRPMIVWNTGTRYIRLRSES